MLHKLNHICLQFQQELKSNPIGKIAKIVNIQIQFLFENFYRKIEQKIPIVKKKFLTKRYDCSINRESMTKTPIMRERSEYIKSKSESSKVQLRETLSSVRPVDKMALGRAISVDGVAAVEGLRPVQLEKNREHGHLVRPDTKPFQKPRIERIFIFPTVLYSNSHAGG